MMQGIRYIFLLCVLILCFACENEEKLIDSPWFYAHPLEHNVNSKSLLELNQELKHGTYGDINSLIIIKDSKVIFENYYNGHKRDDLQPLNGATKSITSALAGIAFDKTDNLEPESLVIDFFPEYSIYFDDVPQKDKINFGHLMNQESGLWWDEQEHGFFSDENEAQIMIESSDWIDYVLGHKMIQVPGQSFNYNSGNAVLAGAMIERAVNMPLQEFAGQNLFRPLNIDKWEWTKDDNGITNAAFGLKMRPADLARIGYVFLKNGVWGDEIVIDNKWVEKSVEAEVALVSYRYGKFWWQLSFNHFLSEKLTFNDMYFAWGEGGQFLFIIPHMDMVIVTTADNYAGNTELYAFQFMADYLLPAVSVSNVPVK